MAYFGKDILQEDGTIFRKKLGEIVFHDEEKLAFLNRCTHTYIVAEMKDQIEQAKQQKELLPALYWMRRCSLKLVWKNSAMLSGWFMPMRKFAPRELWNGMVSAMDLPVARIANQNSWEEYKALSDVVLDNSGVLPICRSSLLWHGKHYKNKQVKKT